MCRGLDKESAHLGQLNTGHMGPVNLKSGHFGEKMTGMEMIDYPLVRDK